MAHPKKTLDIDLETINGALENSEKDLLEDPDKEAEKKQKILFARFPGTEGKDLIFGTEDNDTIEGFEDDDTLLGGEGNDWINGGPGADVIDGGTGVDTASYATAHGPVMVDLTAGKGYSGEAAGDTFISIENVTGSMFDDYIWGNAADNRLSGMDGNDQLWGYAGHDYLNGGNGRDLMVGGDGHDTLEGGADDDQLLGGDGNDTLYGGSAGGRPFPTDGNDSLYGGIGNDLLNGGAGTDHLEGGDGIDRLVGGDGADYLDGGDEYDIAEYALQRGAFYGSLTIDLEAGTGFGGAAQGDVLVNMEILRVIGGGSHTLSGLSERSIIQVAQSTGSTLYGRDGHDTFSLTDTGGNTIDGGAGSDLVQFGDQHADITIDLTQGFSSDTSANPDNTLTEIENIWIVGTANADITGDNQSNDFTLGDGDNIVRGRGGRDLIFGQNGNDEFYGNGGTDFLEGNGGNDTLTGGRGDDTLHGGIEDDVLNGGQGNDFLWGYTGADTFIFENSVDATDQDELYQFEIGIDTADLSGTTIDSFSELINRSTQVGNDTVIDTGSGTITMIDVTLNNLIASDFIF